MARNTLEAVFGALGAGLRGYGQDVSRRREMEQAEIARQDELARMLAERQLRIFQSGLEEAAPATARARNVGQFGQMAQAAQVAMPGPMSAVGRALQSAGSAMQTDIQRGRRTTIGGTEYVQPFSRTAAGIEEREAQRAEAERTARRQEFAEQERIRGERTTREIRERASAGARTTGLSPNDRAYQSTLAFASRLIQDPMGIEEPRFPTPEEVQAFAQQAKTVEGAIYGTARPTQELTADSAAEEWMRENPKRPGETREEYRTRYNASRSGR